MCCKGIESDLLCNIYFEKIDARTLATNGYFFLTMCSNTYPGSTRFQIVTAANPMFKTIADGQTA